MTMTEQDKPLFRTRRRFTGEFKADAVALVLDGEQSIWAVGHVAKRWFTAKKNR